MATLSPSIRAQDDPISSLDLPPIRPGAATGQNGFSFPAKSPLPRKSVWMGFARHTLGIAFLLIAVFLFTASNFLASTIFADNSYSKPYLVTYLNVSSFSVLLPIVGLRRLFKNPKYFREIISRQSLINPTIGEERVAFLKHDNGDASNLPILSPRSQALASDAGIDPPDCNQTHAESIITVRATAKLGFEFGILWFFANYFTTASLTYTSVGSSTILCSTSGIWTLIIGTFANVEKPTLRKIGGVLASLLGILLTSFVDVFGNNDQSRGSFPHKSHVQIAVGDLLALLSAILYGLYTTLMKKRAVNEARINVLLFFGFVGIFTMITLSPGFFILHYTGVEQFELPPTRKITTIVLINIAISFISDICWAYATLLTSPLVVTVGLNLTIPLSLVGQVFLNAQIPSLIYWIGAGIVFLAFVVLNHESKKEEEEGSDVNIIDSNGQGYVHGQDIGDRGSRHTI